MIVSSDFNGFYAAKYSQLSSIPSSPERRFKTVSPCRKLFEGISTNQNDSLGGSFVVSNATSAALTTITSHHNTTNTPPISKQYQETTGNCNLNLKTNSSNFNDLSLTEGIAISYQRRKSISINSPVLSFMDDLGFLPSNNNNNSHGINSNNSVKKTSQFLLLDTPDSINSSLSSIIDLPSSPISSLDLHGHKKKQKLSDFHMSKMTDCSVKKPTFMHWNRRTSSPVIGSSTRNNTLNDNLKPNRRTFSESYGSDSVHHLPCFDSPHDAIKRISPETVINVLEGNYEGLFNKIYIVDCRYPYEFEGGHIPTAVNVNSPDEIESLLFKNPEPDVMIIFHCEFSSERAPRMALHVRNLDRQINKASYPDLHYPEMYILEGGYKNFWEQYHDRCEPSGAYLPMRNPQFKDQLRYHQRIKHAFKSGCHISQHSVIKSLPPKSSQKGKRTKSLNVANARKYFNDFIEGNNESNKSKNETVESKPSSFPSFSIPLANSFSSIFASEIDLFSEMDMDIQ